MSGGKRAAASAAMTSSRLALLTRLSGNLKRFTPSVTTVISKLPTLYRYQPGACVPAGGAAACPERPVASGAAATAVAATVLASRVRRVRSIIAFPPDQFSGHSLFLPKCRRGSYVTAARAVQVAPP